MSGSGGGGSDNDNGNWRPASSVPNSTGGGGGGAGAHNPCAFTELAVLSSPNAQVVAQLTTSSILKIALEQTPLRVVATHQGAIAGSITTARLADIIECIRAGQVYEARVTQINGGLVHIEIYPA